MSRYVDADAMINDVAKFYDEAEHLETFDMVNKICDHIHNAPSIDIVRCKECKHYHKLYGCQYNDDIDLVTDDDDYCSHGERKGE